MKVAILALLSLMVGSVVLVGCGEKVDTDVEGVNKGKGEVRTVTPRNRDAKPGEQGAGR